jgi:uncharacterized repeat protein (TIGR03803 family)
MRLSHLRSFLALQAVLSLGLVIIAFHPIPVSAQNFCGPVTLVNFNGINGQYPASGVTFDNQGNMYGTTAQGGPSFNPIGSNGILNYGLGTLWKYSPGAGLTSLFSFAGSTSPSNNGYRPLMPLVMDGQGNLYGTTYYGGNDFFPDNSHFGWGTIFKYSSAGQFTTLHEFSGPEGANPVGVLLDSQANLWGTTWQGGLGWNPTLGNFGLGTIFEYSSGGTLTNPLLFSTTNGGGNAAAGLTADGQGNYYGTTYEGGTNGFGTLFQYDSATNQLTTLVNFTRTNGSLPAATVTLDGQGNVYGTTYQGGSHSSASNYCCGTVWKYSLSTGALTTKVSFDGDTVPADGMFPQGGVTLDSNGNLYGSTVGGGTFGDGIVYEYSSGDVLSTLVTFSGPNGWSPEGNLVFDSAGNLYGTTNQGGSSGYGTVFKLTPNTGGGTCSGLTLSSLTLNPTTVQDGGTSQGTVTLSAAAPSGGTVVGLSSNSSFALVPANVTVPAGSSSATFTVTTKSGVLSNTSVVITASLGNSTVQASMTITPGSSTVTISSLTLSPSSVQGGRPSQGTVTLSGTAPSGGTVVSLTSNSSSASVPGSVTVAAGATTASFTVTTTSVTTTMTAVITATLGSSSAQASLTIAPPATATAVTTSGSPSMFGQSVTFTATVTSTYGAIPNGEIVTFYDGTTPLSSVPLAGGVAVYATSTLSGKTHTIKATYSGDAKFAPSTGSVKQVVEKYPTTTTLTSSLNPSQFGQAVTFTAQVTSAGPTPTGSVKFLDGTTSIGLATLSGGVAKLTKSTLAVGTHSIAAHYNGDAASTTSTSSVVNQVVQ